MDKNETELARRLRATDRQLPFDPDAFAERVVAERSRRRRRRFVSATGTVAALLLAGWLWQGVHPVEPGSVVRQTTPPGDAIPTEHQRATDRGPTEERSDQDIQSMLAEIDQQRRQLDLLRDRLEKAEAAIAASEAARYRQMLAVYRAEASRDIVVPDLAELYAAAADNPSD